jgi:preprotein translocase SecE subunit
VARDRKRAKQRRDRRAAAAAGRSQAPPTQPVRADVPGALDHASGDVDEFDAALVRGAGGAPVTPRVEPDNGDAAVTPRVDPDADVRPGAEDALQLPVRPGGDGIDGGGGGRGTGVDLAAPGEPTPGAPLRGGNRAVAFLRASWAELQRVQWPDRQQVFQATAVVLGFVAIAGAYLGLADYVAKEIVEFIL